MSVGPAMCTTSRSGPPSGSASRKPATPGAPPSGKVITVKSFSPTRTTWAGTASTFTLLDETVFTVKYAFGPSAMLRRFMVSKR